MSQLQEQLEGLPGYDIVMDYFNEYAEEHFNKLNPYEDKDGNKLRLPEEHTTKSEKKLWKRVQLKAWVHDKCFIGSCGIGMDCGLGLAPLVSILPGIGPILMYIVHARLIHMTAKEIKLPNKLITQLESQIFFDLIITFPPLIGIFLSWINACLTRNAALIYKYMCFVASQREKNSVPTYVGPRSVPQATNHNNKPTYNGARREMNSNYNGQKQKRGNQPNNQVIVGNQQQSGFV